MQKISQINWFTAVRYAWFIILTLLFVAMMGWRYTHTVNLANQPLKVRPKLVNGRNYVVEARRIVSSYGSAALDKPAGVGHGETLVKAVVNQQPPAVPKQAAQVTPQQTPRNGPAESVQVVNVKEHDFTPEGITVRGEGVKLTGMVEDNPTVFRLNEQAHRYPTIADWSNTTGGLYQNIKWKSLLKEKPRVILAMDVLSDADCQSIIDAANRSLARSEVVHAPGQSGVNSVRTSYGMFLSWEDQKLPANQRIRKIVSTLMGVNEVNIEATQVLRYVEGQFYKMHPDYFAKGSEHLSRGGQRFATLLFWLNEVKEGGETQFPLASVEIRPQKGSGVMFYSMTLDGEEDPSSQHEAIPPGPGETKWVAVSWVRQHEFH
jgi:prolyl 4-hydroxylase